MIREGDLVAIFNSIHRVMKAEKVLKERRMAIMLIPVPRSLTSDCGLAIRYAEADRESVLALLAESDLVPEVIYRFTAGDFIRMTDDFSAGS